MFRWSNFSQKFKDMCDWIDKMEFKVISSKDFHIEDLLSRMEKVHKTVTFLLKYIVRKATVNNYC